MLRVRRPEGREREVGGGGRRSAPEGAFLREEKREEKGKGRKRGEEERGKKGKGERKKRENKRKGKRKGNKGKGREFCCIMPLVFTLFQLCRFDVLILLIKIVRAEIY